MNLTNTLYAKTEPGNSAVENAMAFDKRRLNNLFYSLTNFASATIFDVSTIKDIFKYYNEILKDKYSTSDEFSNSLKNSESCFVDPSKLDRAISSLKEEKPDSFLIMPIFSKIHTLTAVIKKQSDGLKFYTVDKFTTHLNSLNLNSPYCTEFIIKKGEEKKLIQELLDKAFTGGSSDITDILKKYAIKSYDLNIKPREQKSFTCLYKEPEAGIKFAFATRNFKEGEFQLLRTKNSFSKSASIKWGNSGNDTLDIHMRLLDKIKKHNPQHNFEDLDKVFKNYLQNKKFRSLIKKGKSFDESLQMAFDPKNRMYNLTTTEKNKLLLTQINFDTIHQIPGLRNKVLSQAGLATLRSYELAKFDTSLMGTYLGVFSNKNFKNIIKNINEQEKRFPIYAKQAKDYYSVVNNVVAYSLFQMYVNSDKNKSVKNIKMESFDYIQKKVDDVLELSPYFDKGHFTKAVIHLNKGFMMEANNLAASKYEFSKAMESLQTTQRLNPNFAEVNYLKAVVHSKLGEQKEASFEFSKAAKTGLIITNNNTFFNKKLPFNYLSKELCTELLQIKEQEKSKNMQALKY